MTQAILLSALAGVVGTMVGGCVSAFMGKKDSVVSLLLAFAAGMMLAVVCFDLVPEAIGYSNLLTTILSMIGGGMVVMLLDFVLDTKRRKKIIKVEVEETNEKSDMTAMSIIMLLTISLHNLPEGMVIGSSEVVAKGALMTVIIGLHNIPEGVSIAAPLIASGKSKWKAILFAALAGVPTVVGSIVGFLIGSVSITFISISLGLAAGAMITVVFSEMLLQAYKIGNGHIVGLVTLISLLLGIVLINVI